MLQKARSAIIYGKSGVGKTANLKQIAKWFVTKYKMKVRMIHGDGGGFDQFNDSDNLIGKGWVDVCDIGNRRLLLQDSQRLADGCWKDSNDIITRPTEFGSATTNLDPEFRRRFFAKQNIGAYLVEGTGSWGSLLLRKRSNQLVAGEGEKASWIWQDGEYAVAGLDGRHYGQVQVVLEELIAKICQLPVKLVVFTGKDQLGVDVTEKTKKTGEKYASSTGMPLYGPDGPGVALTSKVTGWFSNAIHMEEREGEPFRRGWYRKHWEETEIGGSLVNVPYLAKSSCPLEKVEDMENQFGGNGFVQLTPSHSLEEYFEFIDEVNNVKEKTHNAASK